MNKLVNIGFSNNTLVRELHILIEMVIAVQLSNFTLLHLHNSSLCFFILRVPDINAERTGVVSGSLETVFNMFELLFRSTNYKYFELNKCLLDLNFNFATLHPVGFTTPLLFQLAVGCEAPGGKGKQLNIVI